MVATHQFFPSLFPLKKNIELIEGGDGGSQMNDK